VLTEIGDVAMTLKTISISVRMEHFRTSMVYW